MTEVTFEDAVHGSIKIDPVLQEFISTNQFTRLKHIKQLGAASYVFLGATHSRFAHCIGTAHLAGQFLSALETASPDHFRHVTRTDKLCVQLAGLCHDIGHGPFSHLWERVVSQLQDDKNQQVHHEDISLKMLDHLIRKNPDIKKKAGLTDDDIMFVKELINPYKIRQSSRSKPELNFLYQIVANCDTGIDVDKFDYLARDAMHTKQQISFDSRLLLQNCAVREYQGVTHVVFHERVLPCIMELFESRRKMHRQVYQDRRVKGLERLLMRAIEQSLEHVRVNSRTGPMSLLSAHTDMDVFGRLDDSILQRIKAEGPDAAKQDIMKMQSLDLGVCIDGGLVDCDDLQSVDYRQLECQLRSEVSHSGQQLDVWLIPQKLDYSQKSENPLSKVLLYNDMGVFPLSPPYLARISPKTLEDHNLLVFSNRRPENMAQLYKLITKTLANNGITLVRANPSATSNKHAASAAWKGVVRSGASSDLTPRSSRRRTSEEHSYFEDAPPVAKQNNMA